MKKYLNKYFAGLFLALTTFDMGIKQHVEETFQKGKDQNTKVPKIVLRRVHNKGFCLNVLDKYPTLIKGVSASLCGIIGAKAYQLFQKRGRWIEKIGMTVLGAGAVSNTFDRLVRGYVVDYFGVKCKNSKLSKITANLADLYVLVGSAILWRRSIGDGKLRTVQRT